MRSSQEVWKKPPGSLVLIDIQTKEGSDGAATSDEEATQERIGKK